MAPRNTSVSPPPSPPAPLPEREESDLRHIELRGVRVHNLKSIDLDIPHRKLIVLCGLSGSGKSSLALDTLYAEGQRRYIESFSAYTRQFLQRLEKPEAERIDGIPPAIAVTSTEHQPIEPLDRRHGHRSERLSAAAVGQDRPGVLPRLRPRGPPRQSAERGRDAGRPAAGHARYDRVRLPSAGGRKGDSPLLPERPEGCCAQKGTVPFFAVEQLASHYEKTALSVRSLRGGWLASTGRNRPSPLSPLLSPLSTPSSIACGRQRHR